MEQIQHITQRIAASKPFHNFLKAHLLDELDYLMKKDRWKEADEKNWQFILVSAKREKQRYLEVNNVKNFNCKDLKDLIMTLCVSSINLNYSIITK